LDYIIFTSDQVHLLPGFPEQDVFPLQIRLAIYVQFPPGVAQDSSSTLTKNTLLTVISESREKLEKALNVTIINIIAAFLDASTEGSYTVTPPVYREKTMKNYFIIGGAVVGFLFIVVLSLLILCKYCIPRKVFPKEREAAYKDGEAVELDEHCKHQVKGDLGYTNGQIVNNDEYSNNE